MKILVLSDSHRLGRNIADVLERLKDVVSAVVHLGDCVEDMEYYDTLYPHISFYSVAGNSDYNVKHPGELIISINRKKIFITHGHKYSVKYGYERIIGTAVELEADICLFGHTHVPEIFYDGSVIFMNPGSISLPRGKHPVSYGIVDIAENGLIRAQVVAKFGKNFVPIEV